MEKQIVIFASGTGSNAEKIIEHFQKSSLAKVVLVLSNKTNAKALEKAEQLNVEAYSFTKDELLSEQGLIKSLRRSQPDLIGLAGFLLKFPERILKEFRNSVMNMHPALLRRYRGK